MTVARGLYNGVVQEGQVIKRLDGGKGLQVFPFLNVIVVEEEKPQTLEAYKILFRRQ